MCVLDKIYLESALSLLQFVVKYITQVKLHTSKVIELYTVSIFFTFLFLLLLAGIWFCGLEKLLSPIVTSFFIK